MDKGYLVVNVYGVDKTEPISDATVIVRGDNYEQSFRTDNNGKTPIIELDAPLKIYSLTPQSEVRPYSIYQVEVIKQGYETVVVNGVQILPDETSLQDVYFSNNRNRLNGLRTEVIDIPPHSLWEEAKEETTLNNSNINTNTNSSVNTTSTATVNNDTTNNNLNDYRVLPKVLIPEYIIVHEGAPTNTTGANYYVLFTDYIKNVASSEIYSTWPIESIKANVYAILSFTMNRIFTEWYKSRGYNFTITSSPKFDHAYVHNRTIFKTISDVVDQIFYYHIKLGGKNYPFLAQYNDGIKVNNPGWLSQWGSKSLADQGLTALQILRYYYTNDLTLNAADDIEGLPISFPGYNLTLGICGEPVLYLQQMINIISNNFPAIPKIFPVDGQYNANTKRSVEIFQQTFQLPITGIVDFSTWYEISYIYIATSKMLQGIVK